MITFRISKRDAMIVQWSWCKDVMQWYGSTLSENISQGMVTYLAVMLTNRRHSFTSTRKRTIQSTFNCSEECFFGKLHSAFVVVENMMHAFVLTKSCKQNA